MAFKLLTHIFGSRNHRLLRQYRSVVDRINALEPGFEKLSDDDLRSKTSEFKQRLSQGSSLDDLLPEAFAVVREGAKRVMKMRHFDVQLLGGIALHQGKIAEMRTGEGKTLTATLAVYLNALTGKGVHVVTVNDYLAQRDAQWMGRLYNHLGLSVGINLPDLPREEKQAAYRSDITYGTNNEYGFDYLRDNMVYEASERVQRGLHYAIVDEVDAILIDEARTPLIISGQSEDHTATYQAISRLVPQLSKQIGESDPITGEGVITPGDFTVDEKTHQITLTEQGHENIEALFEQAGLLPPGSPLYDPKHISLMHHVNAALRALHLYHKDRHYVVQDNQAVIVDEFTGRLMPGRRWGDGLHQAIEAKEGLHINPESLTLASITFQNYFRLFEKLAGMTGTADTEAYEFQEIYRLETVIIPPNKTSQRQDDNDRVYQSTPEKFRAAIDDIRECHQRQQPVLVGTSSIENSEHISRLLTQADLPHQVLNAKQHAREAEIIAQAGAPGAITIATNMAGRGTDIVLGGNIEKSVELIEADASITDTEKTERISKLRQQWQQDHNLVVQQGGLRIIATERHESRRIDNQLRGRSGRQGDPGSSRFYLSLDDNLMRIFAGEKVKAVMGRLNMPEGEAIEAGMINRSIESAQRKVEAHNFDIRKQLLEFDDVANDQRQVIYQQRNEIIDAAALDTKIAGLRHSSITDLVRNYVPTESVEEQWDLAGLERQLTTEYGLEIDLQSWVKDASDVGDAAILERVIAAADQAYQAKLTRVDREKFHFFVRMVLLQNIDTHWRDHLLALDHLRQGIHLRGFAQKQPKQEYKREAFEMFSLLLDMVKNQVTKALMTVSIETKEEGIPTDPAIEQGHPSGVDAPKDVAAGTPPAVGRNDPCPCGSGEKYKNCHGKLS